jgi:L-asparagine transporter-like permease
MDRLITVSGIALLAAAVNIPLGYWRCSVPRFSVCWFIAVHLSVPLLYEVRVWSAVEIYWIPIFICAAIVGQFGGGRIFQASSLRNPNDEG